MAKHWTADGSRLYVSLVEYQEAGLGPDSGIWVLEVDGGEARQLPGPYDWPPRIVAVSPHGEHLLVLDPTTLGRTDPSYALVDGVSGAIEPVEALTPEADHAAPITGVMLSPDGSLLLTVSGRAAKRVAVRDLAGASEKALSTEPSGAVPSDLAGEVLTWAQNDTVLVNGGRRGRGTLLVLDRGDD